MKQSILKTALIIFLVFNIIPLMFILYLALRWNFDDFNFYLTIYNGFIGGFLWNLFLHFDLRSYFQAANFIFIASEIINFIFIYLYVYLIGLNKKIFLYGFTLIIFLLNIFFGSALYFSIKYF